MHLLRADHVVIIEDQQGLLRSQLVDQRRDQPLERRRRGRSEQRGHPFSGPGAGPVQRGHRVAPPAAAPWCLVIFRSPVIALLPLVVIALVSQVATGLISDVNKALNLNTDSSISTILIVVLFGVGTDYTLFLMFRYRERLRAGEDAKQAMISAVTRVGEVIASAAGVVIVAFLALLLSTLSVLRSMGPALAIAVAVTLIAGLTLIPAVVSLLGPRVFWPSRSWRREPRAARFTAIGHALGRRPGVFAAVSGLVLVALAIAAFGYKPTFDLSSA